MAGILLHPAGALAARLAESRPRSSENSAAFQEHARGRAASIEWSTAEVPLAAGVTIDAPEAEWLSVRERVRDVVALLRLYQKARHPLLNVDHQTFGFEDELGNAVEEHWVTQGAQTRRLGGSLLRADLVIVDDLATIVSGGSSPSPSGTLPSRR